jgi:hypothetical protein
MVTYIAIPQKENDFKETLYSIESGSEPVINSDSDSAAVRSRAVKWLPWCLHLFVFVLSVSAGLLVKPASRCPSVKGSLRSPDEELSITPATDKLLGEHPWNLSVRFNGSLSRDSSPFKGPPSEKVDQLWEGLTPRRLVAPPVKGTPQ